MQSFKNRMDVVRFLSFTHKPCCCILNFFEVCLVSTEGNLKVKSYLSLSERGQNTTVNAAILWPAVCVSDVTSKAGICGKGIEVSQGPNGY